ncbi:MAG: transglycosylase domain-containing protein, partial [Verrucomicrobiota bacterium]
MPKKRKTNRRRAPKKRPKKHTDKPAPLLLRLLFWPYYLLRHLSRTWHPVLRKTTRFAGAAATLTLFLGLAFATLYAFRSTPYDLTQVREMPGRNIILDRSRKEIGRMHGENRQIIPLSEVAKVFEDALLAREDKRFHRHFGVDPFGIARSLLENIKRGGMAQGGSTITMQLARNSFDLESPTLKSAGLDSRLIELDRKFLEIAVAFRIEAQYSKDEILEAYINRIFWGHSFRGVETASQNYFGKPAKNLTLSEAAMLAGIIRGPNAFTPFRYPDRAKRERDSTLDSMVRFGFLTEGEAEAAKKEPLRIQKPTTAQTGWTLNIIRAELEDILSKKNLSNGGLTIVTTLRWSMRAMMRSS